VLANFYNDLFRLSAAVKNSSLKMAASLFGIKKGKPFIFNFFQTKLFLKHFAFQRGNRSQAEPVHKAEQELQRGISQGKNTD